MNHNSRDVEDCGGAPRRKIHPKTSQNSLHSDMAVLVRIAKPKKSFQIDPKRFQKFVTEFF